MANVPTDWRNSRVSRIQQSYNRFDGMDAALAINEGFQAPDLHPGPIWAIFDRAVVERAGWNIDPPFTHPDPGQFFSADTIEELAAKIEAGNEYQRVPLSYLKETVDNWNAAVDADEEDEFERGLDVPRHKIETPTFYAARR